MPAPQPPQTPTTSTQAGGARAGANAPRSRDLGAVALALLALIWGYNWVVMKIGLEYAQPFTFAALRTFLGALSLLVLLVVLRRPLRPVAVVPTIIIGLLQTTGFVGGIIWALESGGAGKTSVLTYTMPFWLLMLAWAFLGERLRGVQWLAVALALAGLILVLSPWRLQGVFSSLLAIGAGLSWAAGSLAVKLLQRRRHVDILSLTMWQMAYGSLPLLVVAALTYSGPPLWTGAFVAALAYNVILGNALAWFLWISALRSLSAGAAGIGTLATPVIGVVAAWIQLGERPGLSEAAGMAFILGGLAIVTARGLLQSRGESQPGRPLPVPLQRT
jgi:drug/metabolite transporter (DMT)-like permease